MMLMAAEGDGRQGMAEEERQRTAVAEERRRTVVEEERRRKVVAEERRRTVVEEGRWTAAAEGRWTAAMEERWTATAEERRTATGGWTATVVAAGRLEVVVAVRRVKAVAARTCSVVEAPELVEVERRSAMGTGSVGEAGWQWVRGEARPSSSGWAVGRPQVAAAGGETQLRWAIGGSQSASLCHRGSTKSTTDRHAFESVAAVHIQQKRDSPRFHAPFLHPLLAG